MTIQARSSSVELNTVSGAESAFFSASHGWTLEQSTGPRTTVALQESKSSPGGTLQATIPDKWVSVSVKTSGGNVSVAKVTEADLAVSSRGGSVRLGSIRAIHADVTTAGGDLKGQELSASVLDVVTSGGSVQLTRLLGQQGRVKTAGGTLAVAALYGDDITLQSGGGSVDVGTMDCSEALCVSSQGGPIKVDSLDGNARLESAGGEVQVHLNRKVGDVHIASGGGDVTIAVCPEAVVSIAVEGTEQLLGGAGFEVVGQQQVAHFRPAEMPTGSGAKEPRWGNLSEGSVKVDAAGGRISITRLTWAEAVRARLSQKGASEAGSSTSSSSGTSSSNTGGNEV